MITDMYFLPSAPVKVSASKLDFLQMRRIGGVMNNSWPTRQLIAKYLFMSFVFFARFASMFDNRNMRMFLNPVMISSSMSYYFVGAEMIIFGLCAVCDLSK